MRHTFIIFAVAMLAFGTAWAQAYEDDESVERQKVSLGLLAGVNASVMAVQMPDDPIEAQAAVAGEIVFFTEYHINKTWGIRLVVAPSVERVGVTRASLSRSVMCTGSLDIALPVTLRLPVGSGGWFVGLGPYSRFVIGGKMSDDSPLPYALQVGQDSITGDPRYAVDRFGSGANVLVGYENERGWIVQGEVRMGLTNILNTETYRGRLLPYKAVVTVGYRF